MVWSWPRHTAARVVSQYRHGATPTELSREHCRSRACISRLVAYYIENDKLPEEGTLPRRCTNKAAVTDADRELHLASIFTEDPSYFISEARDLLNRRAGKIYTTYAVIRAMDRLGLTLKAVRASRLCFFFDVSVVESWSTTQNNEM